MSCSAPACPPALVVRRVILYFKPSSCSKEKAGTLIDTRPNALPLLLATGDESGGSNVHSYSTLHRVGSGFAEMHASDPCPT